MLKSECLREREKCPSTASKSIDPGMGHSHYVTYFLSISTMKMTFH